MVFFDDKVLVWLFFFKGSNWSSNGGKNGGGRREYGMKL